MSAPNLSDLARDKQACERASAALDRADRFVLIFVVTPLLGATLGQFVRWLQMGAPLP